MRQKNQTENGSKCEHKNFRAEVDVNRLEDSGGFAADIRIRCAECDLPFVFGGVECGFSFQKPMCSMSGQELHAPIAPKDSRIFPNLPGFTVKAN
jgi:hypothetical protein